MTNIWDRLIHRTTDDGSPQELPSYTFGFIYLRYIVGNQVICGPLQKLHVSAVMHGKFASVDKLSLWSSQNREASVL